MFVPLETHPCLHEWQRGESVTDALYPVNTRASLIFRLMFFGEFNFLDESLTRRSIGLAARQFGQVQ